LKGRLVWECGIWTAAGVLVAVHPFLHEHWFLRLGLAGILLIACGGRVAQAFARDARPDARQAPRFDLFSTAIAAVVYAALVLLMWSRFAFTSGMPYETNFAYYSDISTWWNGFFDIGDPMRPFTNVFYQVAYLVGVIFGVPGSFVPYQFVYAALWWARGLLAFLILRRLLGGHDFLCYAAGALVLVHASDGALEWVGQLNQFGFIFWLLMAMYLLLCAEAAGSAIAIYWWLVAACACESLCLGSYESGLPILMLTPGGLWLARRRTRFAVIAIAWWSIAGAYFGLSAWRYGHLEPGSYQVSVIRTDWSVASLVSDLVFNVRASLFFWEWPRGISLAVLPAIASILACAGGLLLARRKSRPAPSRVLLACFGYGALTLVASFPVYLLLDSARSLWRTQMLSGIGAAVVLVSAVALIANRFSGRWRWALVLCVTAAVVYAGSARALALGEVHRNNWVRHRKAMAAILRVVPRVRPGTVMIVCGIARDRDPFGDGMWLDRALRLAYPGTAVAGGYFYRDGSAPPGHIFRARGNRWVVEKANQPVLVPSAATSDSILLEYDGERMHVLPAMPASLCIEDCDTRGYRPRERIVEGAPSALALNRYGPI